MNESNESRNSAIYRSWADENPNGHRDWELIAPRIEDECIRRVVVEQLLYEERFAPIFVYLEQQLSGLGMQFYSPGGSIQRRVWILLRELFGLETRSEYIEHSNVRIGLDLLASEIASRCHGARGESQ